MQITSIGLQLVIVTIQIEYRPNPNLELPEPLSSRLKTERPIPMSSQCLENCLVPECACNQDQEGFKYSKRKALQRKSEFDEENWMLALVPLFY